MASLDQRPDRRLFRNFDFVAPFYPFLERALFGDALEKARSAFASQIAAADCVLLIGEGNGRFLANCLNRKLTGSVTIVDTSRKMIALAHARVSHIKHRTTIRFLHSDIRGLNGELGTFDAVVTHFFLDLFRPESQRQIISKIAQLTKADGFWVNVDYLPIMPNPRQRLIDWLQYRFDRCLSGVEANRHYDSAPSIAEAGWTPIGQLEFLEGTVRAQMLIR